MERQFQLNWQATVCEAKQRRQKQKLTQKRLALLAGVSTPTISRFESGAKDIQLSTIMNILTVLGMVDKRHLTFPNPSPHYDFNRDMVVFKGKEGEKTILCAITKEALEDHFNGLDKNLIKVFVINQERIEHQARRKYLLEKLEANGSVLVKTTDI